MQMNFVLQLICAKYKGIINVTKAKRLSAMNAEVGSASHKSFIASARATSLKILRRKRFRMPPKIIAPQAQPQVSRFEKHNSN